MKRETFIKTLICAAFAGFVFCLGASAARAQIVQPFVDCVQPTRDINGALDGNYIIYFGYNNFGTTTAYIAVNSAGNVMSPVRNPPGQPDTFLPGVHSRVFSVLLDLDVNETWRLTTYTLTASFAGSPLCADEGANSRLITYQGRLSDGSQTASGQYDLQFQLFNAATGGTARTTQISVDNVTVTNGVFTVQLDLGVNAVANTGNSVKAVNPAILAGENGFFEIGVRPGNASGAFTTLAPRQLLTAVPFAMRAKTAGNADRAASADRAAVADLAVNATNATNAINAANATNATNAGNADKLGGVEASQYVKTNSAGDLTVGCRSGFTAIANGRLCVSAMQSAATFYGANGAVKTCANLGGRVGNSADLMLTTGTPLDFRGGLASGWLADHIGDNVWAVWTNTSETDFDGIPLNVVNGGANNTAPTLPFRCVY